MARHPYNTGTRRLTDFYRRRRRSLRMHAGRGAKGQGVEKRSVSKVLLVASKYEGMYPIIEIAASSTIASGK